MNEQRDKLKTYLAKGFDRSRLESTGLVLVRCSGCYPAISNGKALHEKNCFNEQKAFSMTMFMFKLWFGLCLMAGLLQSL